MPGRVSTTKKKEVGGKKRGGEFWFGNKRWRKTETGGDNRGRGTENPAHSPYILKGGNMGVEGVEVLGETVGIFRLCKQGALPWGFAWTRGQRSKGGVNIYRKPFIRKVHDRKGDQKEAEKSEGRT